MFLSILLLTILIQLIPYMICLALCILAWRMRWLTWDGAIGAFVMSVVFVLASTEWSSIMVVFFLPLLLFVGGTLLSKLNKSADEKHGRNLKQVMANGGIGTLCLILAFLFRDYSAVIFLKMAFMVSFSVSICDTFSSEIGKFYKGATIDVFTLRSVQPGLSGGISIQGTLGGLAGAISCALMMILVMNKVRFMHAIEIGAFGFAGMLLDSILGSMLQAKYMNEEGSITEQPAQSFRLYKGYAWCTNDVVNMMSNVIIVGLFLLFRLIG